MGFGGSGETDKLLRELISVVKEGGTIEINGQKVGEAIMKYNYSAP